MWVFLTSTKDPPLEHIDKFLIRFGHPDGGSIRIDQGGELAGSHSLVDIVLWKCYYVFKPTGAVAPCNDKLAIHTRPLLYGAGLLAKY
jgi:hypothetical protein